jgi:hypothetical protein
MHKQISARLKKDYTPGDIGFKLFLKNPAIRLRRCVYNDDGDETGAAKERNAAHSAGGK